MMGDVGNRKSEGPVGRRLPIKFGMKRITSRGGGCSGVHSSACMHRGDFLTQGRKEGFIVPLWNYELPR